LAVVGVEWIFNQCRNGGGMMDSRDSTATSDMYSIAARVAYEVGAGIYRALEICTALLPFLK
jgi:hypothetical protein